MVRRPAVTAVVCTRNRPDLLPRSLASIAPQLGPDDELIVVESGDSRAAEAIAALGDPSPGRLLRSSEPGKSHKLNLAIGAARGEVLAFTDDDVEVGRGWIDELTEPFASRDVGVVFGRVEGLTTVGDAPLPSTPAGEAPLQTWNFAHGASMACLAEALRDVGGFDERLGPGAPLHGEEHDLLLRMRERGWRAVVVCGGAVQHIRWRDPGEHRQNLLVYERGSGAFLGAALRRRPVRGLKLVALRLGYQAALFRSGPEGRGYALRALGAFAGGLARGVALKPRRWLP